MKRDKIAHVEQRLLTILQENHIISKKISSKQKNLRKYNFKLNFFNWYRLKSF